MSPCEFFPIGVLSLAYYLNIHTLVTCTLIHFAVTNTFCIAFKGMLTVVCCY